jgi:hypothetical protein
MEHARTFAKKTPAIIAKNVFLKNLFSIFIYGNNIKTTIALIEMVQ